MKKQARPPMDYVSCTFDKSTMEQIKQEAKEQSRSVAAHIRHIIANYFKNKNEVTNGN